MSSEVTSSSISLGNLSLQPCIDKLTQAVLNDKTRLEKFKSADTLFDQVCILLKTSSHKPKVTIRQAVFEIVKELARYGEVDEAKSETLTEEAKIQGSKAFSLHQDDAALSLYSKALQLCPSSSPNLPLLYANRSAVLYHCHKYQECLLDISRAERHGYPGNLQHKVLVRRAQCLQRLGQCEQATAAVATATTALTPPQATTTSVLLSDKLRDSYLKTLQEVEEALREQRLDCTDSHHHDGDGSFAVDERNSNGNAHLKLTGDDNLDNILQSEYEDYLKKCAEYNLLDEPNEAINYMSAALEQRENEREGRHIVARRTVPKGSTVFVERPFASILLPEHHSTYCYNCITRLNCAPVPCIGCRVVVFCSEVCQSAAIGWHRLDCCRLTLTSAGGMAQLALRAVMVAGWPVCRAVMEESTTSQTATSTSPTATNIQYNRCSPLGRYRALHTLVHHMPSTPVEEQIQYCVASIILATALQNKLEHLNGIVNSTSSSVIPEGWGSLEAVAALLYRHIAQLVCNGYAIYQVLAQQSQESGAANCGVESLSQQRLASAIYATSSLMNHSCKPSTMNSYVGNLLVIRTIEDVPAGQQIYSCYGPHYCRHSRSERQSVLQQQYHFTCQCPPCTLPRYLLEERRWSGLQCESCGGLATYEEGQGTVQDQVACHECGAAGPPSQHFREVCGKVQDLQSAGASCIKNGPDTLQQAVYDLQAALQLGKTVYCLDNQFYASIRDTLAMVLSAQGLYKESARVLHNYLKIVERRYGAASVELGHELVKYHRILCQQRLQQSRAGVSSREIKLLQVRISSIFTLCYGNSWKTMLNIEL